MRHHETVCEQLCILVPFEKFGIVMDWLSHMRVRYAVTAAFCVCVCVRESEREREREREKEREKEVLINRVWEGVGELQLAQLTF